MNKCKNCNNELSKALYNDKVINFCKRCGYGLPNNNEYTIINLINCKECNLWFFKEQENVCKCRQLPE